MPFEDEEIWEIYEGLMLSYRESPKTMMWRVIPYIRAVANTLLGEGTARDEVKSRMDLALLTLDTNNKWGAAWVRQQLFEEMRPVTDIAAILQNVKFNPPRAPTFTPTMTVPYQRGAHVGPALKAIAGMRRRVPRDAGRRLVDAALSLNRKFQWCASGPVGLGEWRNSIGGGAGLFEAQRNGFTRWLTTGEAPTDKAKMNCWEAVLYTYFKAGLLGRGRAAYAYRQASKAGLNVLGQAGFGPDPTAWRRQPSQGLHDRALGAYYSRISLFLGMSAAVPFEGVSGSQLRPRPGDLMFFGGRNHVAIYVGRAWADSGAFMAMSLWNTPHSYYCKAPVNTLMRAGRPTFRPPPVSA